MNKEHRLKYYGWSLGDRYDGWRIRNVDPIFSVIPYILRTRIDSQIFFQEKINIDPIEAFIRLHKKDIPDLSIMHVIMAALVRLMSQRPHLNRFVVWNKIFARNYVSFSLAVKSAMSDEGEEMTVKPYFLPTDTLVDVVRKTNIEIENNQHAGKQNTADIIAKVFAYLPDLLLRATVSLILLLDKIGIMPRFIHLASPFHSSFFLTNIGSVGIESIYHHLYEIGTCSLFVSMGKKTRINVLEKDGQIKSNKSIQLKFVLDERICDGFYYALSMRMLVKILADPSVLLLPPEKVIVDEGVGKKRRDI